MSGSVLNSGSNPHSNIENTPRHRYNENNADSSAHSGHQNELHHHHHHLHSHGPIKKQIIPLKEVLSSLSSDESVDSKHLKMRHDPIKNVSLFGIDLSGLSPTLQGAVLIAIILVGFISIGYVEEGFKFEFRAFHFGWFMTAVELFIFSIFAMTERLFKGLTAITSAVYLSSASTVALRPGATNLEQESLLKSAPSAATQRQRGSLAAAFRVNWVSVMFEAQMPMKYHLVVAAAMMISRALTNIALLLLNYPTQVIFKSMKLISVMIGSVCCLKKQYHHCEYVAAPVLVLSAVLFTFGDANDLNFNALGIVVVVVSLIFDAVHANAQQFVLQAQTERDTTMELLVYSNLLAGCMAFAVSFCSGEVIEIQYEYIPSQPAGTASKLVMWFVVRVACLYLGVSAFVVFIKRFGAVFGVTVTTVRKILTVLLSYVFYPGKKAFIPLQHGTGTVLFILSLIMAGYGSVKKKEREKRGRR